MQEQNKSKVTYWLNGETVSKEEFASLVGEYFKWFEGNNVKAVDYSSVESIFDGDHKTQRQINDHLKGVLGGQFKKNRPYNIHSTRHKAKEEGKYHTCPLTPDESFKKSLLSVPKPTKEILDTFKRNMEKIEEKQAYKETEGKLFYELDWGFITQMAERMASNKKEGKYEMFNWKRPMTPKGIEDLKQATMRHLLEVMQGNYEDDGREFGHIEAISDNMMMLNYQLKNNR